MSNFRETLLQLDDLAVANYMGTRPAVYWCWRRILCRGITIVLWKVIISTVLEFCGNPIVRACVSCSSRSALRKSSFFRHSLVALTRLTYTADLAKPRSCAACILASIVNHVERARSAQKATHSGPRFEASTFFQPSINCLAAQRCCIGAGS